jgi:hypothetical protein
LAKNQPSVIQVEKLVEEIVMTPVSQYKMPLLYRMFPAIGVSMKELCVYIGNPYLPTMMQITSKKASGVMSASKVHLSPIITY